MRVLNAMQMKNGAKAESGPTFSSLTQPTQFLPYSKKTDDWAAWNLDWLELQGIEFLRINSRRLLKNYKLAKGVIDKSDYIVEPDNDYKDLMDTLTAENDSALELKFYPIIPNVINVLTGEFAKRYSKVQFRAVDDTSYNEMLEQKRLQIEESLLADAEANLVMKMIEMGMDPGSEEAQQQLSPEGLKSLPEIEDFFSKDYRSMVEEWASHQLAVDEERFHMQELEERGFRDMLISDREFWHFRMLEDDYDVELWNPVLTFYQKSPDQRYISDSNYVGKMDLMTVSDVIDRYGYLMDEKQLKSLQKIYPARSAQYQVNGYQNDGSYYDATRSHEWNTNMPGLAYRQYTSNYWNNPGVGGDILSEILDNSEDMTPLDEGNLMRVSTIYWKTQRRVGHLTKIELNGSVTQEIIDETFKITEKAVYDTSIFKNRTKENLLQGEHIDWIWINEVWGGVKVGPNLPAMWRSTMGDNINPIYVGINRTKPGRLPFQFKGNNTLYGCKLPVEGRVFSDRNTRSTSLVDLMKAYQVGYNMVNNQIADILIDELGTVIMFDQNALPRHSMGEDWGKNNYSKAWVAMKDFQMLPLDTSITNTENATNFNHYQTLNMEQTSRLMSRIQLANYFKQQCFDAIGVNPQRLGGAVSAQTATGVVQAMQQSYAQTEMYFVQHSDQLMPRVHQMRTDLAQYYYSTNPSVRLSYISSEAEKVNFTINGTDLLLRDFNIFATTKTNHRAILENLKQMALTNNTTGASIFELGNIVKADSIAEVTDILKDSENRQQMQRQQDMQQQQQMQQQQIQAKQQEEQMKLQVEIDENEKDRQNNILLAEIKSAGYGSMVDINENKQSDYQDAMEDIKESTRYNQQLSMEREKNNTKMTMENSRLDVEKQKINAQKEIAQTKLDIARENKNKYDAPKSKENKDKK
tara:strand:- start:1654 stop:4413 length:2760 start_codon:yes stop_codon:yes gene_type:complete